MQRGWNFISVAKTRVVCRDELLDKKAQVAVGRIGHGRPLEEKRKSWCEK